MSAQKNQPSLIFIVEDNAIYAKTLQHFLTQKFPGAEVRIFPVGELCLDNLHRNPDVIVMDYSLDSRYYDAANGIDMMKEIRQKNKEVRIVVLSAQQDVAVAVEAMKAGNSFYIPKNEAPFANVEPFILGKVA